MLRQLQEYFPPLLWFFLTNAGVCVQASVSITLTGLTTPLALRGTTIVDIGMGVLVLSTTGAVGMLLASKLILRYFLGARRADDTMGTKVQQLKLIVAAQAGRAGVAPPVLMVYDTREKNAFAVGRGRHHAMLVVSQGLLDSLTLDELSAVIGHEMTHIRNGDVLIRSLMQGVVNVVVYFPARLLGAGLDRVFFPDYPQGPINKTISVLLQLTVGGLASLLVMWFSRQREFQADAGGAKLAGHAEMMAALRALQAGESREPVSHPFAVLGLNSRYLGSGVGRWFTSHPSLSERIEALGK